MLRFDWVKNIYVSKWFFVHCSTHVPPFKIWYECLNLLPVFLLACSDILSVSFRLTSSGGLLASWSCPSYKSKNRNKEIFLNLYPELGCPTTFSARIDAVNVEEDDSSEFSHQEEKEWEDKLNWADFLILRISGVRPAFIAKDVVCRKSKKICHKLNN